MPPVFVNHSGRRLTRFQIASMTAAHLAGVTRCLGPERAHLLLGAEFTWPLASFERISTLTDISTLSTHLEHTRFSHITTL